MNRLTSGVLRGMVFLSIVLVAGLSAQPSEASSVALNSSNLRGLTTAWSRAKPFFVRGLAALPVNTAYVVVGGGRWRASRDYGFHRGVDFAVPIGSPVFSMFTGTVRRIIGGGLCGNGVEIVNGKFRQQFCHVLTNGLRSGQTVRAGDQIGKVDMSGRSSGPHAHVELWVNGQDVDIEAYFRDPKKLGEMIAATTGNSNIAQSENPNSPNNAKDRKHNNSIKDKVTSEKMAWDYLKENREIAKTTSVDGFNEMIKARKSYFNPELAYHSQQLIQMRNADRQKLEQLAQQNKKLTQVNRNLYLTPGNESMRFSYVN